MIPSLRISTRDNGALREAMAALASHGLAGIYSSSEYYVEAAAELASEFGLPGAAPEAVAICRNKYRMRQALDRAGIGVPRFRCATNELQASAYARGGRTISKDLTPVLASGSRHTELGSPSAPAVVSISRGSENSEALHATQHQRRFAWPAGHGNACAIRIFHSWHNCS
jgi:hypothetical protein